MQRRLLKSKIHRATVTQADLHYEGSLTIDESLMDAADILAHEEVHIYNITSGARLSTYAIPGPRETGVIGVNGAAAHLVRPGDLVIIATYGSYSDEESRKHQPRVILVDSQNRTNKVWTKSGHSAAEALVEHPSC